jgi:hypothetical protein
MGYIGVHLLYDHDTDHLRGSMDTQSFLRMAGERVGKGIRVMTSDLQPGDLLESPWGDMRIRSIAVSHTRRVEGKTITFYRIIGYTINTTKVLIMPNDIEWSMYYAKYSSKGY